MQGMLLTSFKIPQMFCFNRSLQIGNTFHLRKNMRAILILADSRQDKPDLSSYTGQTLPMFHYSTWTLQKSLSTHWATTGPCPTTVLCTTLTVSFGTWRHHSSLWSKELEMNEDATEPPAFVWEGKLALILLGSGEEFQKLEVVFLLPVTGILKPTVATGAPTQTLQASEKTLDLTGAQFGLPLEGPGGPLLCSFWNNGFWNPWVLNLWISQTLLYLYDMCRVASWLVSTIKSSLCKQKFPPWTRRASCS